MPVELTSTCALSMPSASAAARAIASASARPLAPVPALALPELTMIAAALPPLSASRRLSRCTGGAANLFCVNTATAVTGWRSSVATSGHIGLALLDSGMKAGGDEARCCRDAHILILPSISRGGGPAVGSVEGPPRQRRLHRRPLHRTACGPPPLQRQGRTNSRAPSWPDSDPRQPGAFIEAEHQIGALDHLSGGSFYEIVERRDDEHAAGARVVTGGDVDGVRSQRPFGRGMRSETWMKRSPA